jgi:hypothetical protein
MQKFIHNHTNNTPDIIFSPDENIFLIRGTSSPEDVREIYYPALEWIRNFLINLRDEKTKRYSKDNPFIFRVELEYFNSSSAKFIHDMLTEFKKINSLGMPVIIEWVYDEDDSDMKEAGSDMAMFVEMEFRYVTK